MKTITMCCIRNQNRSSLHIGAGLSELGGDVRRLFEITIVLITSDDPSDDPAGDQVAQNRFRDIYRLRCLRDGDQLNGHRHLAILRAHHESSTRIGGCR